MTKTTKFIFLLLAIGLGFVAGGAEQVQFEPNAVGVESILATVNGQPISLRDVLLETQGAEARIIAQQPRDEAMLAVQKLREQAVGELIDRKLIMQEYAKRPFALPEQYIESMIDDFVRNSGSKDRAEFLRKLRLSKMSLADLRKRARERLIVSAMVGGYNQMVANVTPRRIFHYFEQHPEEFNEPDQLRLSLILLSQNSLGRAEAEQEIEKSLLADPTSFGRLAEQYSEAGNRAQQGDLGWLEQQKLRPEFRPVLAQKTPDWVKVTIAEEGTYFLKLTDRRAGRKAEFTAELGKKIRQKLEKQANRAAYDAYLQKMRDSADIKRFY